MKSKAILLSVFTSLSDEQIKQLIEKVLTSDLFAINLITLDRVLISDSSYLNDVDSNNKFNFLLTANVPDMTLHEINFITASLNEEKHD